MLTVTEHRFDKNIESNYYIQWSGLNAKVNQRLTKRFTTISRGVCTIHSKII
ncbi:hypothetical protein HanXRQr2_Chr11g0469691 [Helianthus annuus]|uniref:Uncharacterized protein n=1 Tax=Helianthus annuus TaxID=4232 RepID=A0A9K3HKZ4_HELAN|nr:hypothetical protein HanXRQr2_Chr11g0469691 [Helianthus annuus]KAJ0873492.1 hypothetical protein HanPSC8_Chr11g0453131 [Helianthus annuus]